MGMGNELELNEEAAETEAKETELKAKETESEAEEKSETEEVLDKHGNPGINRDKYQRDIKERDDKIAELEAKIAEAAKTEEGRAKLQSELDDLRKTAADKDLTYELKIAGCRDDSAVKAAKALLPDHGNDVAKLKEAVPYLFEQDKPSGSTGLKPGGASSHAAGADKARAALGIKTKR